MAQKYGFFTAQKINGVADRLYTADDFNAFFKGILSDGVYRLSDNALIVETGTRGLSVAVNTGRALVKQHWYTNDAIVTLTLNTAHATLNRYTTIAVRYDKTNRVIELVTVDGSNAETPTPATLTQTDDIYELGLATVYVKAGATSVTANDITDIRTYVSGLVDPVPLNYRRWTYTVTDYETQKYFDVPLSYNLTLNTSLQVFSDGLLCDSSMYKLQINEVEGNYMIVFNEPRIKGAVIEAILIN